MFESFARQINAVQDKTRRNEHAPVPRRAFHAKSLAAVDNATFEVAPTVPCDMTIGPLQPGATWPATVRLSSAAGGIKPDVSKDFRGIAVRIETDRGPQDLLMTSAPASHARDATQFMAVAVAMSSRTRVVGAIRLAFAVGPREALRILRTLREGMDRRVESLALQQFWSRAPFAVGEVAVKLTLAPPAGTPAPERSFEGDDLLRNELATRLAAGPVVYELRAQRFVDEAVTPIEDAAVEWLESTSPSIPVATLTIPVQELRSDDARKLQRSIDELAFTPWNAALDLRPLGSLNRARRPVYESSARHRATASQRIG